MFHHDLPTDPTTSRNNSPVALSSEEADNEQEAQSRNPPGSPIVRVLSSEIAEVSGEGSSSE